MNRNLAYSLVAWGVLLFHLPQLYLMHFLQFAQSGPGGFEAFLFNGLLFLGWAAIHSILARHVVKNVLIRVTGRDFYKLFFVTMAGITQVALIYYWRPLSGVVWETRGITYALLTGAFLLSCAFIFYSSLLLDYMEVLGLRSILRRASNQPQPEPGVLVRGPYAYCRHPVYLGIIFFLWVGPVMTFTRLEFAVLGSIYVVAGAWLEEKTVARELGESWRQYCRNVPMWVPRRTPWRP